MPRASESGRVSPVALVLLLVLPLAGGVGWWVGHLPEPKAAPPAAAPASTSLSPWTTYAEARSESETTGKPVLLDFNAEWCPPCQAMKREVFDAPVFGEDVRRAVIPVAVVDRSREEGANPSEIEELQKRYAVDAFPTLVVFSPRTGRSEKTSGYGDPDATTEWIERAAQKVR